MRKIKQIIVENGIDREIEVEVPDGPPASWGSLEKMRILGKRNPRPEGPDKVSGRAKYGSDVVLPGMCYGRFLFSPHAKAKITAIDLSPAEKLPGVKAVLGLKGAGANLLYAGDLIAAVAAITPEIAEDALRAIKVTYAVEPHVVEMEKSKAPGAPKVRPDGENLRAKGQNKKGDPDAAFAKCAAVIENTYEAATRLHCCLETHGHTVKWDGDKLTVWSSTQFVTGVQGGLAALAGGPKNVRVITEHMGGGFGSKFAPGPEGESAVKLAKMANAPVKFFLTRELEQLTGYRGPGIRSRIRLGAAADGTLLAVDCVSDKDGGIDPSGPIPVEAGFYIIEPQNRSAVWQSVLTNTGNTAALRAPGHPQAAQVWDMALDEVAGKLNMDPLELRRKNHSDPVRLKEWEIGAMVIGWDRRQKVPGSAPGIKKRGIGIGNATWGGGGRKSTDCTVHIKKDGSVVSYSAVQDVGAGVRLYVASIVAEELGLELKDVTPVIGDSNFGPGHASGGSTTTGSAAPAIKMSAVNAREQISLAASKALGVKAEEVELVAGPKFQVKGNPAKSLTWKQVCATLPADGIRAKGDWNEGADLQASGVAGCNFAEVEVDTETGKVTVLKVVGVQDCGLVLNRLQAENQMTGGIIQGIGTAILEERRMDPITGRMLNPNFEEYKLCGAFEAGGVNITMDPPYRAMTPDERGIVTIVYDNPTGKVSGIGEPAIIGVHAAIANAIYNAIGVHVASSPATPDKVLAALRKKNGGAA